MPLENSFPTEIRSALFIDFDNIFITLQDQDPAAAEKFATDPEGWLSWLEQHSPTNYYGSAGSLRRILLRRCYMNPKKFSNYRPYFIRSAFEVIDCPPLTQQGKTTSDIHMVMDIMDALDHPVQYNEFIIFSGDTDFTPVLLRIRKFDRRAVVFAVSYVSPAYKSACDYLIPYDDFVSKGLEMEDLEEAQHNGPQVQISNGTLVLVKKLAGLLRSSIDSPYGIEASELPAIYKALPEFKFGENWLGFRSLRRLTEAVVALDPELKLLDEDPWRVVLLPAAETEPEAQPTNETSPQGVGLLAHDSTRLYPGYTIENNLPASASIPVSRPDHFAAEYPHLAPLARKIHQLTDMPYLTPRDYALLLREIARAVNENGYQMTQTSKTVRDRVTERGGRLARSHVNFILTGLYFAGYRFDPGVHQTAGQLGDVLVQNTITLCKGAQVELTPEEAEMVRSWIMGELDETNGNQAGADEKASK